MSHFHAYEPTLASAAFDGIVIGLACFAMLAGMLWMRRLFERLDRRADASTYEDEEGGL